MSYNDYISPSAGGETTWYFCFACGRNVFIRRRPPPHSLVPRCPICDGGFIQEAGDPDILRFLNILHYQYFLRLQSRRVHTDENGTSNGGRPFLHIYLNNLLSNRENAHVQNNSPMYRDFREYLRHRGLERLIRHLVGNGPVWYGNPPVSRAVAEGLLRINVSAEMISQCVICLDEFNEGGEVRQMPCMHVYHADCIMQWLRLRNSCPVCRYELPTNNAGYENGRNAVVAENGGAREGRPDWRRFRPPRPQYPARSSEHSNNSESSSNVRGESSENGANEGSGMDDIN